MYNTSMTTLTINAGSSSLRFTLFDAKLKVLYRGHIDAIGQSHCHFRRYFKDGTEKKLNLTAANHKEAIAFALTRLVTDKAVDSLRNIEKVAHRVVHGGEAFKAPTKLNLLTLRKLKKLNSLAPLHNPANLAAIQACRSKLRRANHYAIFDTAFHSSLPEHAYLYGLPYELYKKHGIRRYGFHGTSHKYVSKEAARLLKKRNSKIITCHIGNGVSIAAIKNGICLDTSMGFTPLEGPMMGTRCGSIDPAIVTHLAKKIGLEQTEQLLQNESGFKGLSGISSDIRKLWARPKAKGTKRTFAVFSYQMAKIINSYLVALQGSPDAIVFTAGIGEHAHYLRASICEHLQIKLDPIANKADAIQIANKKSTIKVFVIPTQEDLQMAREIS
jgi:acetate kinase